MRHVPWLRMCASRGAAAQRSRTPGLAVPGITHLERLHRGNSRRCGLAVSTAMAAGAAAQPRAPSGVRHGLVGAACVFLVAHGAARHAPRRSALLLSHV